MNLTEEEVKKYNSDGFLLIEDFFSSEEMDLLQKELVKVKEIDSPCRILEKNGQVRSIFGLNQTNEVFNYITRLQCLVNPVRQLLQSEVYIHHTKANTKQAFLGDWWDWHQDFTYWHLEDGMPQPRVLTATIFLDDVNEFNGPLLLVPGSHKIGVVSTVDKKDNSDDPGFMNYQNSTPYMSTLTADLKYTINEEALKEWVSKNGIFSAKGARGSVLFFHGNVFHASYNNLSPWNRDTFLITYNSVENKLKPVKKPRPDFIANRDFRPITPLPNRLLSYTKNSGIVTVAE